MATEMAEVSNRVNFGSKPRCLTCPENVQIRWYCDMSGKKGKEFEFENLKFLIYTLALEISD